MRSCATKRYLCSQRVLVNCSDPGGWWHTVPGNLEEIADESALVLADGPISPGKKVRVFCGEDQVKGTVEACVHDEVLGFFVEVKFDSDCQWSERWFRPQHLLRLTSNAASRAAG